MGCGLNIRPMPPASNTPYDPTWASTAVWMRWESIKIVGHKRRRVTRSEGAVNPKYTYPELFLRVDWLKYVYEFGFDA